MIEAHGLVKRYGATIAVNDLSFSVRPGMVTGFLGPNGAGKPVTELWLTWCRTRLSLDRASPGPRAGKLPHPREP